MVTKQKTLDLEKIMIGLETHVQLNTKTKLFCSCENPVNFSKINKTDDIPPNTLTCEICLGMPGSKPRFNRSVFEKALKVALALNCDISKEYFFSRKTYFYPDMSKNFQITQYERPIAENGFLEIEVDGKIKKIRIMRIHIEEDPAKILHEKNYSLVDYNRAGIPLIEIVTEPDLSSPKEARLYLQKLSLILEYLGVYESDSIATIKSDANISIVGSERVEIKNITGTRDIEKALSYEHIRQKNILKRNGNVVMETRQWIPEAGVTKSMRTKETEDDYGYIFEPDLPYYQINDKQKDNSLKEIPELPDVKKKRFVKDYKLQEKLAESLISDKDLPDLFEMAVKKVSVKNASSWIGIVLKKTLNYNNLTFSSSKLKREWIIEVIRAYEKGEYSDLVTEQIIRKMIEDKRPMKDIVEKYKFSKIDTTNLDSIVRKIIDSNPKAVNDYKKGEEKALHFLVGQLMRETKGSVDPKKAKEEILKMLMLNK